MARSYFNTNPIVQNAINIHTYYPINGFNFFTRNQSVNKFLKNMLDEIDIQNVLTQISQQYWLLGEAFPFATWDEKRGLFTSIKLQDPDYIIIKRDITNLETKIYLKPSEELKFAAIRTPDFFNEKLLNSIKSSENIPLDNFNISHIARILDVSELRGTGLILSVIRQLQMIDIMRERDEKLFDKTEDVSPTPNITYTQLLNEIYIGLCVPKIIIEGNGNSNTAGVSLDVLKQRYLTLRAQIIKWLQKKIFAPVALANDFYENIDGEKRLIIPEITFSNLSLFDMNKSMSEKEKH
jgi:hypothetical protein